MDRKQIEFAGIREKKFDAIREAKDFPPILNNSCVEYGLIKRTICFKDVQEFYDNLKEELGLFHSIRFNGIDEIVHPEERPKDLQRLFEYADEHTPIRIEYCNPKSHLRKGDILIFGKSNDGICCEEAYIAANHLESYSITSKLEGIKSNLEGIKSPILAVYFDRLQDFFSI